MEKKHEEDKVSETSLVEQTNVLLTLASKAQELTGAETVVVALAEDEGENIVYAEAVGKLADWIRGRRGAAATSGLCGVTFQGYSPVLVCDTHGDARVRQDHVSQLGISTALGAPLYFENHLLGSLLLLNKTDGSQFDTHDEERLAHYVSEAAPNLATYLHD